MTQTSAADRKDVRKAEKNATRMEKDRIDGLRHLLSNRTGRLWIWRLLEDAGTFGNTFAGEFPILNGFNCGRQSVGQGIYADICAHFPEIFIQMMRENNDRRTAADTFAEQSRREGRLGNPVEPAPAGVGADERGDAGDDAEAGEQRDFAFPEPRGQA